MRSQTAKLIIDMKLIQCILASVYVINGVCTLSCRLEPAASATESYCAELRN